MAGRGRGMASNQGHSGGPGVGGMPGGDERRELRRPIVGQLGPNTDDITQGMAKMEPYRDDFGRYAGYGSGGQHGTGQSGGQQAMGPPRPAPNADGWSSGENQYGQQQYQGQWNSPAAMNAFVQQDLNGQHQFQQPHNHFTSQGARQPFPDQQVQHALNAQNTAPPGWSFNIGASEFVPKNSNLSISAQEFVPRHMPRNTSYWAQQEQPPQEMIYQQPRNQVPQMPVSPYQEEHNFEASGMQPDYSHTSINSQQPHSHQQGYQHPRTGVYNNSSSNTNHSNSSSGVMGGGYDPREMLSDAVATLVFMPTKFDRTSSQLAEKFNFSVSDVNTLTSLVGNLVETCLSEKNFRSMAGRFCDYLANNVRVEFEGITFRSLLLEKYQAMHSNHTQLISSDPEKFRSLVIFATDLYLQFLGEKSANSSETEEDKPESENRKRQPILADLLHQLYLSALTVGKKDAMNLTTVIDMLKLSGKILEDDENNSNEAAIRTTQMNTLVHEIETLSKNDTEGCQHPANIRKAFSQLLEIRSANWKLEESDRPTIFDIPEAKSSAASAASGRRSNAIKIVKPPEEPSANRGNQQNGNKQTNNTKSSALPPEEQALTEAELRFMSEQMGDTDSECMTGGGESDIGSVDGMMPEEVEAAFQEFLNEQQNGSKSNKS